MRIVPDWQYKYIEKCLYNYNTLKESELLTEKFMVLAIDKAFEFFRGTTHQKMIEEYYFNVSYYRDRKHLTSSGQHFHICSELLHIDASNGYVVRREIIYRIAMNCYGMGVFKV